MQTVRDIQHGVVRFRLANNSFDTAKFQKL